MINVFKATGFLGGRAMECSLSQRKCDWGLVCKTLKNNKLERAVNRIAKLALPHSGSHFELIPISGIIPEPRWKSEHAGQKVMPHLYSFCLNAFAFSSGTPISRINCFHWNCLSIRSILRQKE